MCLPGLIQDEMPGKHPKKNLVEQHGGIQFAENQIKRLSGEARDGLNIFPESKYKDALISALELNFNRNR